VKLSRKKKSRKDYLKNTQKGLDVQGSLLQAMCCVPSRSGSCSPSEPQPDVVRSHVQHNSSDALITVQDLGNLCSDIKNMSTRKAVR